MTETIHQDELVLQFTTAGEWSHLVIVAVRVNGRGPYQFFLDTGSSHSVISDRVALELDLPTQNKTTSRGFADEALEVSVIPLQSLSIESFIVKDLVAYGGLPLVENLDGILGFDFLHHFEATIDYPRSMLRFRQAAAQECPGT